jgi:hypothetical protein
MDEIGLHPAGASPQLASDLLLEHGVTTDRALLDARTAARAAYHDLADTVDWTVPAAVRTPLSEWDFPAARTALGAADAAWSVTGQTDATLPGVDARDGPAARAWEQASTERDLVAAGVLARAQLDAARDVVVAMAVSRAPRDLVAEIGLLGTPTPSIDQAIAAVRDLDTTTATRITTSIRQAVEGASDAGRARIAAAIVVALLIAGLLAWRHSHRGTRTLIATETAAIRTASVPEDAVPATWDDARTEAYAPPAAHHPAPPPPPADP